MRLDLPAGKTSELLARLALAAGSRVRADALIEDLWSTPTGRNTLQSKVSQLRRALGGDKDLVVGDQDGYTLAIEPGDRGRRPRGGARRPGRRCPGRW